MSARDSNAPECPSCNAPLSQNGTFCKACGYDPAVNSTEDSYLDDIDLPQGYAAEEPSGQATRSRWRASVLLLALLIAAWMLVQWLRPIL